MKYAYMRVSTKDKQEFDRQEFALKDFNIDQVFEEKISGTKKASERPEFEKLLAVVQPNDEIYFESMSRMARSMQDLIDTTNLLANQKKAVVIFVKENIRVGGSGLDAMGSLVFNIMGAFAQFERDLIADRTKQALQAKKEQGVKLGRQATYGADVIKKIKELRFMGYTYRDIENEMGISKATAQRLDKEN